MLKNEKGVTLTILVLTILVIILLAGVTMSINMSLNKTVELKEIIVNMELIKSAASVYSDKYINDTVIREDANGNEEVIVSENFVGTKLNVLKNEDIIGGLLSLSDRIAIGTDKDYWFKLDQEDLDTMNIEITLKGEHYIVNYKTLDVAYYKDQLDTNGNYKGVKAKKRINSGVEKEYYFYEDIKSLYTEEVSN